MDKPTRPLPFDVGDTVMVAKGPYKGQVGKVRTILRDSDYLELEGVGTERKIVYPPQVTRQMPSPVIDHRDPIHYKDLQLVTQIRNDDGSVEKVAIHSVELVGKQYDPETNTFRPIRRATYDTSIQIPWPSTGRKLEAGKKPEYNTAADAVDERSYWPTSLVEGPIPGGALDQIINPYSKYKRERYAGKITSADILHAQPPKMPVPPATKKLLEWRAANPKPQRPTLSDSMKEFIGKEMAEGLVKRQKQQAAALADYR